MAELKGSLARAVLLNKQILLLCRIRLSLERVVSFSNFTLVFFGVCGV